MSTSKNENVAAVEAYVQYIESVRLLSEKTVVSYRCDLLKLVAFANERNLGLFDLTYEDARRFTASIINEGYKETSINRFLASVRSFYRHAYKIHTIDANPFERISFAKRSRRLPSVLTIEEVRRIIDGNPEEFFPLRDVLMFNMFYSTGCRLSELLGMNLTDLDMDQKRVLLRGKGSKERYAFLSARTCRLLKDYLPLRKAFVDKKNQPSEILFVNTKGVRLSASSVHSIFRTYRLKLGISKRFTPHVFRHSFATHMLDNDSGIRVVQELLGHASISTTQIYSHVSNERLRRVYDACHPHGRKK